MIRFERVPEPPEFDQKARVPGNHWLAANPGTQRPKDFWTPFKGALAQGFRDLCAYSAMYEPVGTDDRGCRAPRSPPFFSDSRSEHRLPDTAGVGQVSTSAPRGPALRPP